MPKNQIVTKGTLKNTINIALAGNPNVGKSVIFNQLTGLAQNIGNWPGKTVEKKEGYLNFLGYRFNIVDLPGIYSLSTYSLEEIVSRDYLASDEVDIIINVIDATNLDRNLFLTFQLLDLKIPMILAINQMDILRKRNIDIDFKKFEEILKIPVLPVVAVHGEGVHQLLEEAIELIVYQRAHSHYDGSEPKECAHHSHDYYRTEHIGVKINADLCLKKEFKFPDLSKVLEFGREVESKIQALSEKILNFSTIMNYPPRFLAIKLLENDVEIKKAYSAHKELSEIVGITDQYRKDLENEHGEDIYTIISSEIYKNIRKLVDKVKLIKANEDIKKQTLADKLDHLTTHSIWGYVILILILLGAYLFTFSIGDFFGNLISSFYEILSENVYQTFGADNLIIIVFWNGGVGGIFGALGGVLVYVIPFFLVIEILQDTGYLPRAAFLMDRVMHPLGIHGKVIINMILGLGCNVPACSGCRIMETMREKKIAIALTSLVPCAAVMTVVLGIVGRYLGVMWLLFLFSINFLVVLFVGKMLNKILPGSCTELIMELHEYRIPNYNVILKQTWIRTKEFIYKALPLIIILGVVLEILIIFKILDPINYVLSPITVFWLGLPILTGVFLIYGIFRKELTLVLLIVYANSIGLTLLELLTPIQMIVFCLVTMLYIPCLTTIIVIAKETGWKYSIQITLLEVGLAILIGGMIHFGYEFITLLG